MPPPVLTYATFAAGRPYHAALVPVTSGNAALRPHGHLDFHELIYVVEGRGRCWSGGESLDLRSGDLMLARPRDVHDYAGSGPVGLRFINVAFPSTPWRAFTELAGVDVARGWERAGAPPRGHDQDGALGKAFHDALRAYARRPHPLDLIRLWTVAVDRIEGVGEAADPRPGWLIAACGAMSAEEHLREGLPRLLALAAVSHGHLARSMREHYGCTPLQFVTERRLDHAVMLLTATTEPIGTVAWRCGFHSQTYFDRQFRRRYDCSPRDFRERARRAVVP